MGSYQVLSCDGGGVRAVLTARLIQGFEEVKDGQASEYFDAIYGSSAGSMVASALASPNPPKAKKIVQFFHEYAPKIFSATYLEDAYSLDGFRINKYTDEGLCTALKAIAGETKFVDLIRQVKFPAVDTTSGKQLWFSRDQARENNWNDLEVLDVLRATTAAPTYFAGKSITLDGVEHHLLDGGISYNNPLRRAALDVLNAQEHKPDGVFLSIGTGETSFSIPQSLFEHGGAIQWISPLINLMGRFQQDISTDETKELIADPNNLMRIEPLLAKDIPLDDATKLDELEKSAADWIADNDDKLRAFCSKFKKIAGEH